MSVNDDLDKLNLRLGVDCFGHSFKFRVHDTGIGPKLQVKRYGLWRYVRYLFGSSPTALRGSAEEAARDWMREFADKQRMAKSRPIRLHGFLLQTPRKTTDYILVEDDA